MSTNASDDPPHTPLRNVRITRTSPSAIDPNVDIFDSPQDVPPSNPPTTSANSLLRDQLLAMQQQMDLLRDQLRNQQQVALLRPSVQRTFSREYWVTPIKQLDIVYPGEDAAKTAKLAYKQRLEAYLSKSPPIWDLITGKSPCPITTNDTAIATIKSIYGASWTFEPKDLDSVMDLLESNSPETHKQVSDALNKDSDTMPGSWLQRNAVLYAAISDTLDLSKKGKDLSILQVVQANNGLALHHLLYSRLRDVKSTDPLARAIKLKLGIQHIRYVPSAHGVATYFANIEAHRQKLAQLPRPKIIADWEIVAKATQELPPIHPKFESTKSMLELQRKFEKRETTLKECRDAFISAELDNDIHVDLGTKKSPTKRKLRANVQRHQPPRRQPKNTSPVRYPKGSCVHHPFSLTHTTTQCINPFGYHSAFARATTHIDKCAAVQKSIAAGWSPKAKHVTIPEGFGSPRVPAPGMLNDSNRTVSVNVATATPNVSINASDMQTYRRVKAFMQTASATPAAPVNPQNPVQNPTPPFTQPQHQFVQQMTPTPTIRALQLAHHYSPHHQPMMYGVQTAYPQIPYLQPSTFPTMHPALSAPATSPQRPTMPIVRANVAALSQAGLPPPTDDELIAAGMKYYASQSGRQDFC